MVTIINFDGDGDGHGNGDGTFKQALRVYSHVPLKSPFCQCHLSSLPAATKLDQGNVFTGVCDSVHGGGGCLPQCMMGYPLPLGADTPSPREQKPPWEQTPSPGADTPHPRSRLPPGADPSGTRHLPPWEADTSIRSMSGRYTSYWNAFLFLLFLPPAKFAKVMFLQVSVHTGGACMVAPGGCVVALGGMWLLGGACVVAPGGVRGCSWGHAWLLWGGMHGCSRGHAWLLLGGMHGCSGGACMVAPGGMCMVAPGGVHGCSRGHVWLLWGACMVFARGHVWFFWGGMHVFFRGGMRGIRRDTVNERAVRILLECILV